MSDEKKKTPSNQRQHNLHLKGVLWLPLKAHDLVMSLLYGRPQIFAPAKKPFQNSRKVIAYNFLLIVEKNIIADTMHLLESFCILIQSVTDTCSWRPKWQYLRIGWDNGLALKGDKSLPKSTLTKYRCAVERQRQQVSFPSWQIIRYWGGLAMNEICYRHKIYIG